MHSRLYAHCRIVSLARDTEESDKGSWRFKTNPSPFLQWAFVVFFILSVMAVLAFGFASYWIVSVMPFGQLGAHVCVNGKRNQERKQERWLMVEINSRIEFMVIRLQRQIQQRKQIYRSRRNWKRTSAFGNKNVGPWDVPLLTFADDNSFLGG